MSHYDWLNIYLTLFINKCYEQDGLVDNSIMQGEYGGMVSAHGDKCYGYNYKWEAAGIPFEHGVAVYMLTYLNPWRSTVRDTERGWVDPCQWVINTYPKYKSILENYPIEND